MICHIRSNYVHNALQFVPILGKTILHCADGTLMSAEVKYGTQAISMTAITLQLQDT